MTMTAKDWEQTVLHDQGDHSVAAADARALEMDDSFIPQGMYCYARLVPMGPDTNGFPQMRPIVCPFWASDPSKGDQQYGYCAKLKTGDWMEEGTMLLWDMVKECGINDDIPDDIEEEAL